jgi:hypothetical protein
MKTTKFLPFVASTVLMLASGSSALAAGVINITTSPFDYDSNLTGTLGFKFTVSSNFALGALGVYDAGYDGIANPANVGLWTADGTLLTETVVPQGTAGELDGQFRFSDVTPVVLQAGVEYVVGAFLDGDLASSFSTDPSWAGFGGVGSIDPRVTIIEDRYSGSSTLSYAFPGLTDIQDLGGVPYAWVGANFREASVVPVPAAVWLFGSALAGLGAVRRRPGRVVRAM